MNGRWFRLACRAVRTKQIDYSDWKGTLRDFQRERYLLDDLERELEANNLRTYLMVAMPERLPLADSARNLEMPWISNARDDKTVIEELDEFLEESTK